MNTIAESTSASYVSSDSSYDESGFLITNETLGNIDKTGSLGELNENRFDIISSPSGCLDCSIIQQSQILLRKINPLIESFQNNNSWACKKL